METEPTADPRPLGVLINPASGRDARRLFARAMTTTPEAKRNQVERILVGLEERLSGRGVRFAGLVIPSKQVVYASQVRRSDASMGEAFWEAVFKEQVLTGELIDMLDRAGIEWVDATPALRSRFETGPSPYPEWDDEHPNGVGYGAIAEAVAPLVTAEEARPGTRGPG